MKIATQQSTVAMSNVVPHTSQGFSIKASGTAFKILSSQLYSDKILAVIREISCNAYDSHVAAGKADTPIKVHLPTHLEPWFAVADQGTGLPKEDMMRLYTTYFDSTKSDSNSFVGAFGLGSKAPFAYTTSFTVTNVFRGVKYIATAYVGEDFLPNLQVIKVEDTQQPDGIEVKVPVKSVDISEFVTKASTFFVEFKPFPHLNTQLQVPKAWPVVFENERVRVDKNVSGYSGGILAKTVAVLQGNVTYAVDNSILLNELGNFRFTLKFPIGSLDIAASREALSYDDNTIIAVQDAYRKALADFAAFINSKIATFGTRFEAQVYMTEELRNINNRTGFDYFSYKGKVLSSNSHIFMYDYKPSQVQTEVGHIVKRTRNGSIRIEKYSRDGNAPGVPCRNLFSDLHLPYASTSRFFINDDARPANGVKRFKQLVADTKNTNVVLFEIEKNQTDLLNFLGIDSFEKISAFPLPQRESNSGQGNGRTESKTSKVIVIGQQATGSPQAHVVRDYAEKEFTALSNKNANVVYFRLLEDTEAKLRRSSISLEHLYARIVDTMNYVSLDTKNLKIAFLRRAVPSRQIKKHWKSLPLVLDTCSDKLVTMLESTGGYVPSSARREIEHSYIAKLCTTVYSRAGVRFDCEAINAMHKWVTLCSDKNHKMCELAVNFLSSITVRTCFGTKTVEFKKNDTSVFDLENVVKSKYPLLNHVARSLERSITAKGLDQEDVEHLIKYLEMVNSSST